MSNESEVTTPSAVQIDLSKLGNFTPRLMALVADSIEYIDPDQSEAIRNVFSVGAGVHIEDPHAAVRRHLIAALHWMRSMSSGRSLSLAITNLEQSQHWFAEVE